MTKAEQIEVIKKKIKFEKDFLDEQIKKRNEARKEFEDCLIEECQEKQSKLDTCYTAVSNQYMYLCGVLATAYELKLISKNEYGKLCKQAFDEALN
ncbi:hypothetical protein [Faecalibacillus intestinalis]|uniref:hypothetical protein n=1 Tax=Faecalibacillus intestinalis TaxID=1982626 RepID=UPI003AB396D5